MQSHLHEWKRGQSARGSHAIEWHRRTNIPGLVFDLKPDINGSHRAAPILFGLWVARQPGNFGLIRQSVFIGQEFSFPENECAQPVYQYIVGMPTYIYETTDPAKPVRTFEV